MTELYVEPGLRRPEPRRGGPDLLWAVVAALLVTGIIALVLQNLDEPIRAEASEVHQNDHWCREIADGRMEVVGPQGDLEALCAEWGVELTQVL